MDLKAMRAKQLEHAAFYKITHILTLTYPPSDDFKLAFKENMFMKNNKNGFQQVVYYLFNILDEEKLKQNAPAGIYDSRSETQFRKYIIKYIKELNTTYKNANIPEVVMSHLISPGLKLITFLLKLSQLVLFQHLQRNSSIANKMLLQMKTSKNHEVTSEIILNLRHITSDIYGKCNKLEADFCKQFTSRRIEASEIVKQFSENAQAFKDNLLRIKVLQTSQNENMSSYPQLENLKNETKLEFLESINLKVQKYNTQLQSYLSTKSVELKHDKGALVHFDYKCVGENLDFVDLFEKFVKVIDNKRLTLQPLSKEELEEQMARFQKLNQHLSAMNQSIAEICQEYSKLCEDSEDGLENDLGVAPLPDSPQ